MELHERDFFINRIISGVLFFNYKGLTLEIRTPKPNVKYKASVIYQNHYDACIKDEVLTEEQTFETLKLNNLWTDEDEKALDETIPKDIETLKYKLYINESRPSIREQTEMLLDNWKKELRDLQARRNQFFNHTCHASALYQQKEYEIKKSTFLNGKRFKWKAGDIRSAVSFYYNTSIPNSVFRELARTAPWTVFVSASKYTTGIFDKPSTQLSDEQLTLLYWTSFYDSVSQAHDAPPSRIIENDDMLDGWLIMKNKEAKEREKESVSNNLVKNQKIANSDEIFMPVKTSQEASEIDALNSGHAAALKQSRITQVKQCGQVDHRDLYDVKQDLNIQKAQLFRGKMKEARNKGK